MDDLPKSCKSVSLFDDRLRVFIVGTAHVSSKSSEDVETVISMIRPNMVAVELCSARSSLLNPREDNPLEEDEQIGTYEVIKRSYQQYRQTKSLIPMMYMLLASFMGKIAKELHVKTGVEFESAGRICARLQIPILFVDRPVSITLGRLWKALSTMEKLKLVFSLLWYKPSQKDVDQITEAIDSDFEESDFMKEGMEELTQKFPKIKDVLVVERDMYMAHIVLDRCKRILNLPIFESDIRIVMVVGKGHVEGLTHYLKNESDIREFGDLIETGKGDPFHTLRKFIRYTVRIILALFVLFFGIFVWRFLL